MKLNSLFKVRRYILFGLPFRPQEIKQQLIEVLKLGGDGHKPLSSERKVALGLCRLGG